MAAPEATSAPLEVLIIGAGFGGICAAIKLRERGIDNFRVYDKAEGIGGTWWHNTYPGAACDIASPLYCYSFEPNPDWSRKYSPQAEIQAYIENCSEKYGVRDRVELGRQITTIKFLEGLWVTSFSDGSSQTSRHIVFATGGLHTPAYPDIPGRTEFTGPVMHSARWDHSVDFGDKRVAVIGSAASAIQLIPELAKVAAQVDVYQRTPNYIAPRGDRSYKSWEKKMFRRLPWTLWLYRQIQFFRGELVLFPVVKTRDRSRWRDRLQGFVKRHIRKSVHDPQLAQAMTPDYPLGCKRILIADNFYSAVNKDNVKVVTRGLQRIESRGPVTDDGTLHPVDIIVYATGFDLENYLCDIDVYDKDGINLKERWVDGPGVYKGGFVPGLPNFYMTTGPNTGVGTSSVVTLIEAQLKLILQAIDLAGSDNLIEVYESASESYTRDIRESLKHTVWASSCDSWYKKDNGDIDTLYPHNVRTFIRDHRKLKLEDFRLYPRAALNAAVLPQRSKQARSAVE